MNDELRKTIQKLSDEELIILLYVKSNDYTEAAIKIAEEEIKIRKISKDTIKRIIK